MAAQQAVRRDETAPAPEPRSLGLGALLGAVADHHPARVAFIDQPGKAEWCGRPPITWTYAAAREIVARLAAGLVRLGLPPGSPVGLCMAGIAEHHLTLLAVEQAGHVPCLLPVTWSEDRLLEAVERAQVAAILTQGQLGPDRPAERLCRVAARYFPLRFLAAFGPHVPDGVIALDRVVLDHRGEAGGTGAGSGIVSFAPAVPEPAARRLAGAPVARLPGAAEPDGPLLALRRDGDALTAAAAACLAPGRIEPGERILSLLPPSDLKGLATGLAAALLSGASLECHPVFDAGILAAALDRPEPTHLVAPAWMEAGLARTSVPSRLRGITYVHRAPARLAGREPGRAGIVDVVAFDETALLAGRRGAHDVGLVLAAPERAGTGGLLQVRRDPDGRLAFAGPAAAAHVLNRGAVQPPPADGWHVTRFRAALFAGVATAVAIA
ncbi:AMP-binding protein [Methylobacterium oryzihabitans]|uniref:Long-chain fatty acid--CoA ligase n=1 Tax=Methylobacterium oryzihabitans TaxID=2499852 RepID=A0A437P689_9HYPH|nr:AMP-binding protein [Methylobacterium oryzihabitans]RVU17773.1 long-chain fatty acid--CoA ligase [Methylobacterium oryzihabitans]